MDQLEATVVAALAQQAGDVFDERSVVEKIRVDTVFDELVVLVDYGLSGIRKYRCTFPEAERLAETYGYLTEPVAAEPESSGEITVPAAEPAGDAGVDQQPAE